MIFRWLALCALLTLFSPAQDGGQLYLTYCAACHAENGQGATDGQFPPLAGSEWLADEPDRAIQVVLHGLQGPVQVKGKTFNLFMPPQGAVISDDQIAAILTHVRSSWGNSADKVTTESVKKARAVSTDRSTMWKSAELLKLHPLPKKESALRNVTSRIYHGEFKDLPDFDKLEAKNIEEEHDGLISVEDADRKERFGLVWEGDFITTQSGKHTFKLDCDDGGRVLINGEKIVEVRGLGPMNGSRAKQTTIKLEKGSHPIRIEYYEFGGNENIALSWKGPKGPWHPLSKGVNRKHAPSHPSIPIEPSPERAAIYRNFIANTTPRAIGIGFPGGVNMAYSADHLAPELVWTGKFIDGGLHWTNRGQGKQVPAGEKVVKLSSHPAMPEGTRFRGYELDGAGNPTFVSTLDGLKISDSYKASSGKLIRTISVSGKGETIEILAADKVQSLSTRGRTTRGSSPGITDIRASGTITLTLLEGMPLEIRAHTLRRKKEGEFLLIAPGKSATITYSWPQ